MIVNLTIKSFRGSEMIETWCGAEMEEWRNGDGRSWCSGGILTIREAGRRDEMNMSVVGFVVGF